MGAFSRRYLRHAVKTIVDDCLVSVGFEILEQSPFQHSVTHTSSGPVGCVPSAFLLKHLLEVAVLLKMVGAYSVPSLFISGEGAGILLFERQGLHVLVALWLVTHNMHTLFKKPATLSVLAHGREQASPYCSCGSARGQNVSKSRIWGLAMSLISTLSVHTCSPHDHSFASACRCDLYRLAYRHEPRLVRDAGETLHSVVSDLMVEEQWHSHQRRSRIRRRSIGKSSKLSFGKKSLKVCSSPSRAGIYSNPTEISSTALFHVS